MKRKFDYFRIEDLEKYPENRPYFEKGVEEILTGKCRAHKDRFGMKSEIKLTDGNRFNCSALLVFFMRKCTAAGFNYDWAVAFCEAYCKLVGWKYYTDYPLSCWIEEVVVKPFFIIDKEDFYTKYVKREGVDWELVNQDEILRFLCYVAVCYSKYGASFDSVNTNRIFDLVTQMGSDEPKRLKKEGSGQLPKAWTKFSNELLTFSANDVFATIKITLKQECEEAYAEALEAVNRLIEPEGLFPNSYSIDFRSPEKNYLPIKGLPKKGINQFFANAVRYPALWDRIEQYATLAMKEFEWYTNLNDEQSLMPSSFAVFALGLADEKYFPLVEKYMNTCDSEHSSMQQKFTPAFVEKHGITAKSLPTFISCICSFQNPEHHEIFKKAADEETARQLLKDYKSHPEKYLPNISKRDYERIWDTVITTIYNLPDSQNITF